MEKYPPNILKTMRVVVAVIVAIWHEHHGKFVCVCVWVCVCMLLVVWFWGGMVGWGMGNLRWFDSEFLRLRHHIIQTLTYTHKHCFANTNRAYHFGPESESMLMLSRVRPNEFVCACVFVCLSMCGVGMATVTLVPCSLVCVSNIWTHGKTKRRHITNTQTHTRYTQHYRL